MSAAAKKSAGDEALAVMAALVMEDGRRWGEVAADFQWQDAEAILAGDIRRHFLTRSRGGSKTDDLAGICIAAALTQAPVAAKMYALAADQEQGTLLVDSLIGFKERTDFLQGDALKVGRYSAAFGTVELEILAADEAGAWGKRPWFLVVDELAQWTSSPKSKRLYEAMYTAMGKIDAARMVILTSAGDPAHWSKQILDRADASKNWRVHEVRGPAPWTPLSFLEEMKESLPESSYRRLFENEWTASEDRLTNTDDLAACALIDTPLPPEPGRRYVIGVDLGIKHDRTVVTVCHREKVLRHADQKVELERRQAKAAATMGMRVWLDRVDVWEGTPERPVPLRIVEDHIAELAGTYNRALVHGDPFQAVQMYQSLRSRGIRVEEFTFSSASVGRLAAMLHQLLRNHALALPRDDSELLDELANVRLRETSPGVLRMDHDPDKHDDRAIALALAAWPLMGRRPDAGRIGSGPSVYS